MLTCVSPLSASLMGLVKLSQLLVSELLALARLLWLRGALRVSSHAGGGGGGGRGSWQGGGVVREAGGNKNVLIYLYQVAH